MLTLKTKKCLALVTQMMYISGSGPIRWDYNQKRIASVGSKLYLAYSILNFLVMSGFEAFLGFRTFQTLVPPDGSDINLPLACHMLYTLSCYSIPIHLQMCTFLRWREIQPFINSYIDFYNQFKEKYIVPTTKERKNGCETLCKVFITLAGLITLQNAVLLLRKPERPFFLTSLLNNPQKANILKRLPLMILHFHIWNSFWAQLLFYGHVLYTYAFPGLFLIRQMRNSSRTESMGITNGRLRTPHTFMRMYRCLQVQHNLFEFCLRDSFFPGHKVTMGAAVVFSIYGGVKLDGGRAVLMTFVALTGCAYLAVLFRRLGKFYELSVDMRDSWKGQNHMIDRFIRSSPAVQINVGNYYFVCRTTVINLGGIILNSAINLLVTF